MGFLSPALARLGDRRSRQPLLVQHGHGAHPNLHASRWRPPPIGERRAARAAAWSGDAHLRDGARLGAQLRRPRLFAQGGLPHPGWALAPLPRPDGPGYEHLPPGAVFLAERPPEAGPARRSCRQMECQPAAAPLLAAPGQRLQARGVVLLRQLPKHPGRERRFHPPRRLQRRLAQPLPCLRPPGAALEWRDPPEGIPQPGAHSR